MKKIILTILISAIFPIYFASADIAGDATDKLWSFGNQSGTLVNETPVTPSNIIVNSIKILLGLLGLIFLIVIIISGLEWMTSGGDKTIIDKAKSRIKNAVIGMFIILASYIIVSTVFSMLGKPLPDRVWSHRLFKW